MLVVCICVTQKQKPARPSALPSRPPPPRPSPISSLGTALPGQSQGQTGRSGLTPSPVAGRAAATPSPTPLGRRPTAIVISPPGNNSFWSGLIFCCCLLL